MSPRRPTRVPPISALCVGPPSSTSATVSFQTGCHMGLHKDLSGCGITSWGAVIPGFLNLLLSRNLARSCHLQRTLSPFPRQNHLKVLGLPSQGESALGEGQEKL